MWEIVGKLICMFKGRSNLSIDSKGRTSMPQRYRGVFCANKKCKLVVTADKDKCLLIFTLKNWENIEKKINDQNINYYVDYVVNQLFKANKYFNDQAPWTKKDDSLRLNTIVFVSLELIRKISILLYPIIPNTSLKVLNIFSIKEKDIKFDTISNNEYLKDKKEIIKLGILFEKIKK